MGKLNKLLHKPLRAFTLYALLILACSIPLYYAVVDYIWLKELDEHNVIVRDKIKASLAAASIPPNEMEMLLPYWNSLLPGTSIVATNQSSARPDSLYSVDRLNQHQESGEIDRFRGLSTLINIQGRTYQLQIETNVEEASETFVAISIVTVTMFGLLALGFILLNRRLSKKIWQPFHTTLHQLTSFDISQQKTVDFAATDIEEFHVLHKSLQKLIDNNIAAYQQQKTFIENASHELQTPLAVLQSKLELLIQQPQDTHATADIVAAIELPVSRITRINKNLLLLAKIDNQQFPETERVDIKTIVSETLELVDDYIASKEIILYPHLPEELLVEGNKTLIEILISNLIINAITHNYRGGSITIHLEGGGITVSNSGTQALDSSKVFERFAKAATTSASSGLGLAIVKEICSRYGWTLTYRFSDLQHQFAVQF